MTAKQLEALLISLRACVEARRWASGKSLAEVWKECERGDWLLWLCGRMVGKRGWPIRKEIVLVACEIAETALHLYEAKHPKDDRPRKAIESARAWAECKDDSKKEKLAAAADAAANAANAADANAAAANAAYAAADAAANAAYISTKMEKLKEFANVVRKRLKIPQ